MPISPTLHRPRDLDELLDLLSEHGDTARVLAGGTAFTLFYKMGLLEIDHIVASDRVPNLAYIHEDGDVIRLGALTRLRAIETSPIVRRRLPVLAAAMRLVANLRVRNSATIGGNLAEADHTSDPPAMLTALGARVLLQRRDGSRWVPLTEFFQGFFETAIEPDEYLVEVEVPVPEPGWHGMYRKFLSRTAEDRTCLGTAVFVKVADGVCAGLRVCAVGAGPTPLRRGDIDEAFVGQSFGGHPLGVEAGRTLGRRYAEASAPISDHRGSAEYRKRVLVPLIERTLSDAVAGYDGAALS